MGSWVTDGLVAHYPFNGDASDASGNGNNGVISGVGLTNDRFDQANGAIEITAQNQYGDHAQQ